MDKKLAYWPATNDTARYQIGSSGVTALSNGNYGVLSPNWDNEAAAIAGAVTKRRLKMKAKFRFVLTVLTLVVLAVLIPAPRSTRSAGPWYVAPGGSDDNDCLNSTTACATINGALNMPGFVAGDTILVATGVYTGTGTEVVRLNKNVTLSGGWDADFTTQSGISTIDGQGVRRGILNETVVGPSGTVVIERFAVQNCSCLCFGSGISNEGILTLNYNTISNNATAPGTGGGGGISSSNVLTLNNSTVSGNIAESGGGIYGAGTVILNNSTITGNTARGVCGGISYYSFHDNMTLNSSTISGNMAEDRGGICVIGSPSTLQNTILAGNIGSDSPDCYGIVGSAGYNLIGNTTGCTFNPTTGDLTDVDARLGPLEGSPGYHPLILGSPAINAGNPAGCTGSTGLLTTDQRGFPRFDRCDIGAYELQPIGFSTKNVDPPSATRGDILTYTIVLTNGGAINLANIHLTDTVPVSLTYVDDSLTATSGSYGYNNQVITWTGSVNAGTTETITFGATVNQTAPLGGIILNSANIDDGGEIFTRTATINIPPAHVFLPLVTRKYCSLFSDNFSNPASGWDVVERDDGKWSYEDGEYQISVNKYNWYLATTAPTPAYNNYTVQATMRMYSGNSGDYGLIFGWLDWGKFYVFKIDPINQYFGVWRMPSWSPLQNWTFSSIINPGSASNVLKVSRDGSQIQVYVNGTLLTTVYDNTFTGNTWSGLIAGSYHDSILPIQARFDDFQLVELCNPSNFDNEGKTLSNSDPNAKCGPNNIPIFKK